MGKQGAGMLLAAVGAIAFIAATVKFMTGFYTDEVVPWMVVLVVGAALAGIGQKLFTAGRREGAN